VVLSGAALLALAVGGGLALVLPARQPLLDGRDAMIAGRDRLLVGDAAGAGRSFARAEAAFRDAGDRLGNPLTTLASFVPIAGRTPDAVTAGAGAGILIARAGRVVARAAEELPGGAGALAPRDGVIPIEPFRRLAGPLAEARDLVAEAARTVDGAPRRLVPDPVADAVERLDQETGQALRALRAGAAMSRALPPFLGEDGPRRYLMAAQNPAELRGTGGLVGAFAVLTIETGRIELGPFSDIDDLHSARPPIEPPTEEFAALYGDLGALEDFSNVNMTPDFPSAATAMERLYERSTGQRLDGTIAADPEALALLLQASGPTDVPGTGATVDAGSVVSFVANEAYALLPDDAARKRLLGKVASGVLGRFLQSGAASDPATAGRVVFEAAADGHLLLHAADPEIQERFERARVAGSLLDPAGDFLAVVVNNSGGNKIDFYATRTVRYEADLARDGTATGTAEVTLVNDAPRRGQPAYVIGPYPFTEARPGENLMRVSAYCARLCRFDDIRRDGRSVGVALGQELGHPLAIHGFGLPAGEQTSLRYAWTTREAWSGDEYGGIYRLTVQSQPTLAQTRLEVEVQIPEGMDVASASPGMRVLGDRVVWSGEAGDVTAFEVEFVRKLFGVL
jgi:hypothetical protein